MIQPVLGTTTVAIGQAPQQNAALSDVIQTPSGASQVVVQAIMNPGDIDGNVGNSATITLYWSRDGVSMNQAARRSPGMILQ